MDIQESMLMKWLRWLYRFPSFFFNIVMQQAQRSLPVVSIAQIFKESSQGIASSKSFYIDTIPKLKGKTIGTFGRVNKLQLFALLNKYNLLDKVEIVIQEP